MASADGLILAIDQGTSSTKIAVVDRTGVVVREAASPVRQRHPHPGWTEQDAEEIWAGLRAAVDSCLDQVGVGQVVGVALSVQRETVVLWDRRSGDVVAPVLSWQDQRTVGAAAELAAAGHADRIFATTGLPLDPMFSALKVRWLLDEHDPLRTRTASGEWCVGTVDAWLLARLCPRRGAETQTEIGSASRTQLLELATGDWSGDLLDLFAVPKACLPSVVASTGPFGVVDGLHHALDGVPVLAVLADSHAALFAHAGWRPGVVKATYGTGSSVMALGRATTGRSGVCSTIAWELGGTGGPAYAVEANIRSTGRTLTWLADFLGIDPESVWHEAAGADSGGVVIVPAFGGLGAPYWDAGARAAISGLTLGSGRAQVSRAAVESVAHQVDDVLLAFEEVIGPIGQLACDGGMTRSSALMQLQADLSGVPVHVSAMSNLSVLGAAHLAGWVVGWWSLTDLEAAAAGIGSPAVSGLQPSIDRADRAERRARWADAVGRVRRSVDRHEMETTA